MLQRLAASDSPAAARHHPPGRQAGPRAEARAAARGRCWRASSGIEVIQPEQLHAPEVLERIAAAKPEVLTTCAFGVLIKEPLLSDYEMINVHPSLLPRWRGAAPIERAIMAGDDETGVAIMRVTAGWDSGAVYATATTPIAADDDYGTLAARLETIGGRPAGQGLGRAPDAAGAGRGARHLRAQDRRARARAGPDAVAAGGRAHDPRAAAAHRLPPAAARRDVPGRARGPRRRPDAGAGRRPRPHRWRAAAAGLQRRRARADRDPAARRASDARLRLAARAPRSRPDRLPLRPGAPGPRPGRADRQGARGVGRRRRGVGAAHLRARRPRQLARCSTR